MRILCSAFLFLFLIGVSLYPESVFHLKEAVTVRSSEVALQELVQEKLPDNAGLRIKTDRTYSNAEISGMLLKAGIRDFILIGNASDVRNVPETAPAAAYGPEADVYNRMVNPVTGSSGEEERFFLRVIDRNSGDAVLKKGPITIITRVRILRHSDTEGYLVQNPFSGKRFAIPSEVPMRAQGE